jgi:hypothetical protein
MRLSSPSDELNRTMRKPILAVVLVFTALVAVANIGLKLAGAMRQVGALAGANVGSAVSAVDPEGARAKSVSVAPPAPSARAAVEQSAPATEPGAPASEQSPRFDTEAALREAGDRDANVAELLNDPDPAVGSAVRDFITSLAPPGGN